MKRQPIRVLVITPTLAPAGGLVRWTRELIRGLEMVADPDQLGIDVLVRGRMDYARTTVQQYKLDCRLHEVAVNSGSARERVQSIRRVSRLIGELRPHVIHVPFGSIWMLAGATRRSQVVATAHGMPSKKLIRPYNRLLAQHLVRRKRGVLLANTRSLCDPLDRLVGAPAGTALALPVGTDPLPVDEAGADKRLLRELFGIEAEEQIVSVIGRLVSEKRVDLVLDVAERMRSEGQVCRFMICGEGPERAPLRVAAEGRGLSRDVMFLGHVPEPGGFLLGANALLHPSDSEGAPFAAIEALLAGTPVVGTNVGGMRDIVRSGLEGRLATRGDADGLARMLVEVLQEPDRRRDRAELARSTFSLRQMGKSHLDLIEQLVGRV